MLSIPKFLASRIEESRLHRFATCWKISSAQTGDVWQFTDHPRELVLFDSLTYSPMDGMQSDSMQKLTDLRSQNRETRGIVSSSAISEDILRTGRLRDARVDEYLVDWWVPWADPIERSVYFIQDVSFDHDVWTAEIKAKLSQLEEPTGRLWGPGCGVPLYSLGVGLCNIDKGLFQEFGVVQEIVSFGPPLVIRNSIPMSNENTDYWKDGFLEFTTGQNTGLFFLVDQVEDGGSPLPNESSRITLGEWVPNGIASAPALIGTGDFFFCAPGCNHQSGVENLEGDCVNKFNNLENYQGEPHIPGRDRSFRGAPL